MRTTWITAAALCLAAVASPALAQVQDDAKAVLNESAKALKDTKGVTFSVKTYATSILKDIIDLSGEVKLWRPPGATTLTWRVDGRAKDPGKADRELHIVSDGTTVTWLDYKENKRFSRPMTDSNAQEASNMCKELILPEWNSPTPFALEMDATKYPILEKLPINNVNGEVCDQVQAMPIGKDRNRTWSISVKDRLPRQLELGTGNAAQKISKITDISNIKMANLTQKDFEIALPNGFVDDKFVPPAAPVEPKGETPVKAPDMGLKAGTPAPAFEAKDASGKNISMGAMKGNVVVMEFWGTMFKPSTANAADMKTLSSTFKDTKFVGLACRERDAKACTDFWTTSGLSYPLITKGDTIATDYKVVGFPSYYIIDDKGAVSAFFQNYPGMDKLKAAIEAAGGK